MAFPLIFSIFTSVKTNTKSMETFTIRAYGRTELAQFYFPGLNPQTAYRKLPRSLRPVNEPTYGKSEYWYR